MAFPQTVLPLVSELLIDGAWTDVTSDVRRDSGNGVRVSRKPLSWAESLAPTTAAWTFDNSALAYYDRNPASANFGKLGRNTQARHRLRPILSTFAVAVVTGWGAADTDQAWTTTGGAAGDHSVPTPYAQQALTSTNVARFAHMAAVGSDYAVRATMTPTVVAATASIEGQVWARSDGTDQNGYRVVLSFQTSGAVNIFLQKRVAGSITTLDSTSSFATYGASDAFVAELSVRGDLLRARVWNAGDPETTGWDLRATDSTFTDAGHIGVLSIRSTTNSNGTINFRWDDIQLSDYRFWGEIPSWTPQADQTGNDKYLPVIAAGIGQRLQAGARPLRSALTRAMEGISAGDFVPVAHWPMEEPSGATRFGSLIPGIAPAIATGAVTAASYGGAEGSASVPVLDAGGQIAGTFPPVVLEPDGSGGTVWQFQFMAMIPSSIAGADSAFLDIAVPDTGGDRIVRLRVEWDDSFEILTMRSYDRNGVAVGTGAALDFATYGSYLFDTAVLYGISIVQHTPGGPVSQQFAAFLPDNPTSPFDYGSNVLTTTVMFTPQSWRAYASAANAGWSFSHSALYIDPAIITESNQQDNADALDGFRGERAGARMIRLARETATPFELIGDEDDTMPCDAQPIDTLLNIFKAAADADQGILHEPRDSFALAYRTRTSLYNTASAVSLSMSSDKHLTRFNLTDDDRSVRNLVTAKRASGASATVEITDGRTSTVDPPDGIGVYPEELTWNIAYDDDLAPFAGWRAHRLGWDEPRYPVAGVDRERPAISGDTAVNAGVLALDLGGHYTLTDPRTYLPPDDVDLLVQGYDETLANFEHKITWNGLPERPYRVFVFDSAVLGRLEGDYYLRTAVNSSATAWQIATASGPVLTTVDADDGWQWMIEGEVVTVTDVAPSTIALRGVGTASSGSSGSRTPGAPASLATGDLVVIFASTRNSGTGIPDTPADWFRYPVFDASANCQAFGRIYDGVWSMPTITYTGGSANEDTIAQSAAFSGKFNDVEQTYLAGAGRLNVSAQDVISAGVPLTGLPVNFIALNLAWKQDDFTSAAPAASWTEIQEASSTAGNDASQVWAYRVFTAAAAVGALQPTYTITGGASAISRGGVLCLRSDYQDVTVTRSVNTVSKAQAAGAVPHLYPAPHLAL